MKSQLVVKKATMKQETTVEEGIGKFIASQAIGLRALLEMTERQSLSVTEVVAQGRVKEFAPGRAPFEEFVQVEDMLRSGITVDQIATLGATGNLPMLTAPETQIALVRLVENYGFRAIVRQVLLKLICGSKLRLTYCVHLSGSSQRGHQISTG